MIRKYIRKPIETQKNNHIMCYTFKVKIVDNKSNNTSYEKRK